MTLGRSRNEKRAGLADGIRIKLLEDDADDAEAQSARIGEKVDAMKGILTGVLVTLATASVLLGINLAVGAFGVGR
jgi:hypothetical protein